MRKETPEVGWGNFVTIDAGDDGVLALRYDWRGNSVLILHNLHSQPVEVTFNPRIGGEGRELIDIVDGESSHADEHGRHTVMLDPYGYRWYRAGGLDDLLERREI